MCFSVSWSYEKDIKQLKEDDLSEREYFGDAETSSSDSEQERCHYENQFEARFSKGKSSISLYSLYSPGSIYKYNFIIFRRFIAIIAKTDRK